MLGVSRPEILKPKNEIACANTTPVEKNGDSSRSVQRLSSRGTVKEEPEVKANAGKKRKPASGAYGDIMSWRFRPRAYQKGRLKIGSVVNENKKNTTKHGNVSELMDSSAVHKAAVLTEKNVSESKSVPDKEIDQLLYKDQKNGDISKIAERGFKVESDDVDFPVWMLGGKTGWVYFSSKPPAEGEGVEDYFPLMTYDPPQQIMDALNAAGEHQCVPMEAVYPNDSHMEPETLCELRAFLRSDAVNEIFDEVLNEGATEKPKPIVTLKKPSPNVPGNTKGYQVDQIKPLPRMNKENERDVVKTEKVKTERSQDECMNVKNVAMVSGHHAEFTHFHRPQRIKKIPVRLLDYVRYADNSEEGVQIKSDPDSNLPITTSSNGCPTQIAEQHFLSNRGLPNKTSNNLDERCDDDYKANRSIRSEPSSNLSSSSFPTVLNQQPPSVFKQNRPQRTKKIPARLIDYDIGEVYKATSINRELDSNRSESTYSHGYPRFLDSVKLEPEDDVRKQKNITIKAEKSTESKWSRKSSTVDEPIFQSSARRAHQQLP